MVGATERQGHTMRRKRRQFLQHLATVAPPRVWARPFWRADQRNTRTADAVVTSVRVLTSKDVTLCVFAG